VDALAFSPDGRFLAAGSRENFVDIYEAMGDFKHVGRCRGHSSYIISLDWSVIPETGDDQLYLMSCSVRRRYRQRHNTRCTVPGPA
jgi:WD40 repeat protein